MPHAMCNLAMLWILPLLLGSPPPPPAPTLAVPSSPFAADPSEAYPAQRDDLMPAPSAAADALEAEQQPDGAPPSTGQSMEAAKPTLFSHAPSSEPLGGPAPEVDADDEPAVDWRYADRRVRHTAHDFSMLFGLAPGGINGSLLYAIPVAQRGFLPINDAFNIEFGLLLMGSNMWQSYAKNQFDLLPAAGVRWDFYLSQMVRTFMTFKIGPRIGVQGDKTVSPAPIVGGGVDIAFARRAHLRMELNYPQLFAFGLSVPLGHIAP